MTKIPFCSVPEALEELRRGRPLLLTDSEEEDSVGDIILAAEHITPDLVNFISKRTAGMLGLAMTPEKCEALHLISHSQDTAPDGRAMTDTVDAASTRVGISARDRATTILTAIADNAGPSELRRPGHIFPLRARSGGVLARVGTTEASVDLAKMAGLKPAAVIGAVVDEEGELARLPALGQLVRKHGLKVASIASVIAYRLKNETLIQRVSTAEVTNAYGTFHLIAYFSPLDRQAHYVMAKGQLPRENSGTRPVVDQPVLVRVHSECLTGDVFHSRRCDCGDQLAGALRMIEKEGEGALVYLRQEGRGIGLLDKLRAYELQEHGRDTIEANAELGHPPDRRNYGIGWQILRDLGIRNLRLITNNPDKISSLRAFGLDITERVPLPVAPNEANRKYLETKRTKMGHLLD